MIENIMTDERVDVRHPNEREGVAQAPDGVQIPVRYWLGEHGRGAVVFVHGLMSHAGWFSPTGEWFLAKGLSAVALDRRGSGQSGARRGHMEDYNELVGEIGAALDMIHSLRPGAAIHLAGQCYGALPVLHYAVAHPDRLASLTLLSPGIRTHATLTPVQGAVAAVMNLLRPHHPIPVPLRCEDFTDVPDQLEFIRKDALKLEAATSRFYMQTLRMMWAIRGRAQKVTTPTFMALAGRDCVCDNDAARKFFDRLGTDDKRRGDYGESMHSLEYGPNRAQLLEDWLGWIEAHESGAGNKGELNEK